MRFYRASRPTYLPGPVEDDIGTLRWIPVAGARVVGIPVPITVFRIEFETRKILADAYHDASVAIRNVIDLDPESGVFETGMLKGVPLDVRQQARFV